MNLPSRLVRPWLWSPNRSTGGGISVSASGALTATAPSLVGSERTAIGATGALTGSAPTLSVSGLEWFRYPIFDVNGTPGAGTTMARAGATARDPMTGIAVAADKARVRPVSIGGLTLYAPLIEGARTNRMKLNVGAQVAFWNASNATVTESAQKAPDNSTTLIKVVSTNASGPRVSRSATTTNGATICSSCIFWYGGDSNRYATFFHDSGAGGVTSKGLIVDLATGTITRTSPISGRTLRCGIHDVTPAGWAGGGKFWRVWIVGTSDWTFQDFGFGPSDGTTFAFEELPSGAIGTIVYGGCVQVEEAVLFPSSPILTPADAEVTRNADACDWTIGAELDDGQGTLLVVSFGAWRQSLLWGGGGTATDLAFGRSSQIALDTTLDSDDHDPAITAPAVGAVTSWALTWDAAGRKEYRDGVLLSSGGTAGKVAKGTVVRIGAKSDATLHAFDYCTAVFYPTALTAAALAALHASISVPGLTLVADVAPDAAMQCWGDSLTEYSGCYPSRLRDKIMAGGGACTQGNNGHSGENSTQVRVRRVTFGAHAEQMHIVWAVQNDFRTVAQATTLAEIATMVALSPTNTLVMGAHLGNTAALPNDAVGQPDYAKAISLNSALAAAYGAQYLDVRPLVIDGTGNTDTTLLVDDIHFNGAGYDVVASGVYAKGQTLGWWK